jgi:hypothetical protein
LETLPEQYEAATERLEEIRKVLREDKGDRERLLKEREEAFDLREAEEQKYLDAVYAARTGGTADLDGSVVDVRCFHPAVMEISMESDGNLQIFHIANYFEVEFRAVDYTPEGELNPCADLNGKRLTIEYIATPGAAFAGEIRSIAMYKN